MRRVNSKSLPIPISFWLKVRPNRRRPTPALNLRRRVKSKSRSPVRKSAPEQAHNPHPRVALRIRVSICSAAWCRDGAQLRASIYQAKEAGAILDQVDGFFQARAEAVLAQ